MRGGSRRRCTSIHAGSGLVTASLRIRRVWSSRRFRIWLTAVLVGIFFGITALGLPLEDLYTGARSVLLRKPVPQSIVVVKIDQRTLDAMGADDVPRAKDAELLDRLFDEGVRRVFFDRSYHFQEDADQDNALAAALRRNEGRVFFGTIMGEGDGLTETSMTPAPVFASAQWVSLMVLAHPFKLNFSFPYKSRAGDREIPVMSAALAGVDVSGKSGYFQPDLSYDASTIPSVSYIDVLEGKVPVASLKDRDILVAPAAINYNDIHQIPFQGFVPGAMVHVLAAHTLREKWMVELGWYPAFALVIVILGTTLTRRARVSHMRMAGLFAVLVALPLLLDMFGWRIEVVPAAVTAGIVWVRMRLLEKVERATLFNVSSGLPSLQALRQVDQPLTGNLVALKIRNYSAIVAAFPQPVDALLANEIVRRIQISDPGVVVYHEADMLVWPSRVNNPLDLVDHLEGLHRIVQNGIIIDEREIDLSFNCGVDCDDDRPIANRIANAQQAAEQAVRNDEIVYLHDASRHETRWEMSLLSSMDRAIDNGEIWVAYQPKLDLASGTITGAEALVRWTHPERGPISPEEFIGIAEQYHRIDRITRFVLTEAVQSATRINALGYDFSVSVNVSAQLLRTPILKEMIVEVLEATGLPPGKLILEVTETDKLDRTSATFAMMQKLVDLGVRLSIDDFGTGNATIDYLRYLPANEVKIDKGFISGIAINRDDLLLVQSMIEMAHSLGRTVVAEGIEDAGTMAILRAMHCDQIQGYHVSRPVRFDFLVDLMEPGRLRHYG